MIKKEAPPFDFKIHIFLEDCEDRNAARDHQRSLIMKILHQLKAFDAVNIQDSFLKDMARNDKKGNDKLRFTFILGTE